MLQPKYNAVITIYSNSDVIGIELAQALDKSAKSRLEALEQYEGVSIHQNAVNPSDAEFEIIYSSVYAGEDVANEIKEILEKEGITNIKIVSREEHKNLLDERRKNRIGLRGFGNSPSKPKP
jgi:protein-L-isoaspartate O-methyltransferase